MQLATYYVYNLFSLSLSLYTGWQDTCPDVSNPDQNPEACQVNVTVEGCPYGPDSEWNITWANTERGENDTQRCPGGVDTLGKTGVVLRVIWLCACSVCVR